MNWLLQANTEVKKSWKRIAANVTHSGFFQSRGMWTTPRGIKQLITHNDTDTVSTADLSFIIGTITCNNGYSHYNVILEGKKLYLHRHSYLAQEGWSVVCGLKTWVLPPSADCPSLTCTGWSLWQPRRHRISLKSRLLWRQEVGIRERRRCYIGGSYQCVARVTELQCALIGRLDCDWHWERLGRSRWLLQSRNGKFHFNRKLAKTHHSVVATSP